MTLTELINEVYTITNRPDLVAQTLLAVRSATLKAHQADYFPKDLFETGIEFTESEYIQQIPYRTILPRWRALKYLRKFDATATPAPGVAGQFFEVVLPELVLDSYTLNREDICYVAGEVLQVRSSTAFTHALLGCYLNPDISQATFSSWIALDHPYAIVFDAAARIFKLIGKSDEMAMYKQEMGEQYQLIKTSSILAQGY